MSQPTAFTTTNDNSRLRLLHGLKNGTKPIMTFQAIGDWRLSQLICATGLDGVIVDCEHGHVSDDAMHATVAAISAFGISPLVRIRAPHADLIKRALDTGAHGIVVPQINTAEEAQAIVNASKFPPQGLRGQGSPFPAFAHGLTIPQYMKSANETLITCVQIETRAGLENVEAISAVPGIDMIFIGPNDLAQAILGYVPAKGDEPEFVAAIDKIVAAAKKSGKWVSRLSNSGTLAQEHLKVFDTVAMGADLKAVNVWYTSELEIARA